MSLPAGDGHRLAETKGITLSNIIIDSIDESTGETLVTAEIDPTDNANSPTFAELGVREEIAAALRDIGIEHTFAIQELTLPLALAGEDLIGQARTGMGKTFGFGVPMLHRIAGVDPSVVPLDGTARALVIVPTRELCIQVSLDLEIASRYLRTPAGRGVSVAALYGGRPYEAQIEMLRAGVDVVVGTPGRLLDFADRGRLTLDNVAVLVLDEADEMLDLGFLPDIERILAMLGAGGRVGFTDKRRQTMLFSATMPGPIITLARTFLTRPTHIRAEEPHSSAIHDRTEQFVYRAHALDKAELVARVLQADRRGATMIFTRTKRSAQKVADDLTGRGFAVGAVHGDLAQPARERALGKFRSGSIDVLVATDVAARGIDIDGVTHVVNYQCPDDEKIYVHRIGRTGRAGRTGVAITLVDWDELPRWSAIDQALSLGKPDPVETYSTSGHLYNDLGIPAGASGVTLVRSDRADRPDDGTVRSRSARNRQRTRGAKRTREASRTPVDNATNAIVSPQHPARRRRRRRRTRAAADESLVVER